MSVSFTWRPINPNKGISFGTGSSLNSALTTAFGDFPIRLTDKDIPILKGIIACGHEDLYELIEAISENDEIEINSHW